MRFARLKYDGQPQRLPNALALTTDASAAYQCIARASPAYSSARCHRVFYDDAKHVQHKHLGANNRR